MKIATVTDCHIMDRSPKNRKDKVRETIFKKLEWCYQTAIDNKCAYMLIPGDLFDSSNSSYELVSDFVSLLLKYPLEIRTLVVPGQHDMRYHTRGLKNTPLGLLEASMLVQIPTIENPIVLNNETKVYGCGWGDEPKLKELMDSETGIEHQKDILLIHKTITYRDPLFPGQIDYINAESFLKRYPFKLVLSGDNHQRFQYTLGWQTLVNGGSVLRLSKDQKDYQPRMHIIDLDTGKKPVTYFYLNIPIEKNVFNEEELKEEEERDERKAKMDDLLAKIAIDQTKLDFPTILNSLTEKTKPNKRVMEMLDDILEKAHMGLGG